MYEKEIAEIINNYSSGKLKYEQKKASMFISGVKSDLVGIYETVLLQYQSHK
tara:strand:- start:321 stop:476 length:156 start_codon:yes stop_codon:yes gene_type:complete